MSKAVPISHGRRSQSSPRKAMPGKVRARSASSVSASTTAPLLRCVRRASALISFSVAAETRMLNG
jgi:hypothetical protein